MAYLRRFGLKSLQIETRAIGIRMSVPEQRKFARRKRQSKKKKGKGAGAGDDSGAEAPRGAIREQPKRNSAKKKDPDFENGSDQDFEPETERRRKKR
jgi:hypothetical protein